MKTKHFLTSLLLLAAVGLLPSCNDWFPWNPTPPTPKPTRLVSLSDGQRTQTYQYNAAGQIIKAAGLFQPNFYFKEIERNPAVYPFASPCAKGNGFFKAKYDAAGKVSELDYYVCDADSLQPVLRYTPVYSPEGKLTGYTGRQRIPAQGNSYAYIDLATFTNNQFPFPGYAYGLEDTTLTLVGRRINGIFEGGYTYTKYMGIEQYTPVETDGRFAILSEILYDSKKNPFNNSFFQLLFAVSVEDYTQTSPELDFYANLFKPVAMFKNSNPNKITVFDYNPATQTKERKKATAYYAYQYNRQEFPTSIRITGVNADSTAFKSRDYTLTYQ